MPNALRCSVHRILKPKWTFYVMNWRFVCHEPTLAPSINTFLRERHCLSGNLLPFSQLPLHVGTQLWGTQVTLFKPGPDPIKLFSASIEATLKFQPIRAVT